MVIMTGTNQREDGGRNDQLRLFLLGLGIFLILMAPVVGILPGPGGMLVLAAGLALTLKNSNWAKRRYVRFKQRWPRYGRWTDWGLRRPSYFRRSEEHTSELQSLMRISYAVFCLKNNKSSHCYNKNHYNDNQTKTKRIELN